MGPGGWFACACVLESVPAGRGWRWRTVGPRWGAEAAQHREGPGCLARPGEALPRWRRLARPPTAWPPLHLPPTPAASQVFCLAFSPDLTKMVTASGDGMLKVNAWMGVGRAGRAARRLAAATAAAAPALASAQPPCSTFLCAQVWNINVRYHMSEDPKVRITKKWREEAGS